MASMVDGVIVFVLWFIPFLTGLLVGVLRQHPAARPESEQQGTHRSVYQQGLRLAMLPGIALFVVLTIISLMFSLVAGYAGGHPPVSFLILQGIGIVLIIGISLGGLTIAGAVSGAALQHRGA